MLSFLEPGDLGLKITESIKNCYTFSKNFANLAKIEHIFAQMSIKTYKSDYKIEIQCCTRNILLLFASFQL